MDLYDYFESLYPNADPEELSSYVDLVRSHDSEKLPPTQVVLDFIEITKKIKALQETEKELRKEVIKQYSTLNHQFNGLSICRPVTRKYNIDKLYEWAKSNCNDVFFNQCESVIIDKKKVEAKIIDLILRGDIDPTTIPEDLLDESDSVRIEVSRKRKS